MSQRDSIIEKAISQLGYREGPNNWTIYGEWYGLQNQPWCAMFVSWCANQVGISEDIIKPFASCTTGYRWFDSLGESTREHIRPQKGDIIFFKWQDDGTPDHVGLVEYVDGNTIHTIEGNRSDKVGRWSYNINSSEIYGYSKPAYTDEPAPEPPSPSGKVETVADVQRYLISKYGFDPNWVVVDGCAGPVTFNALTQAFQIACGFTGDDIDGIVGPKTKEQMRIHLVVEGMTGDFVELVQCALICHNHPVSGFGVFDEDTGNEVENFQREKGLDPDRKVGVNTWSELL